ncbi:MAG: fdnI [Frankiales bacterium]|nr:fdnI [Frankiales bacterium]
MTWTASWGARTVVTMSAPDPVRRFAPAVRRVHRAMAVLMGSCVVTAAFLYVPGLSVVVGHRYVVATVHEYSGFALPVPLLLGLLSPDYRSDLRRMNRFSPVDRQWLRRSNRRLGLPVGKFNAGQKLNGALSVGAMGVLLGTGILMFDTHLVRLSLRTGATFVHDWSALALGLLLVGHVLKASRDREAGQGMKTGDVSLAWAKEHHPGWAAEFESAPEY